MLMDAIGIVSTAGISEKQGTSPPLSGCGVWFSSVLANPAPFTWRRQGGKITDSNIDKGGATTSKKK